MKLTIAAAHKLTGISITTLHRHTKLGKLAYSRNSNNEKIVDVAELQRAYPEADFQLPNEDNENADNHKQEALVKVENPPPDPMTDRFITALESENAHLRSQLRITQNQNDKLLNIVDNQVLALPKPADDPEPKKSWWHRLRFATMI